MIANPSKATDFVNTSVAFDEGDGTISDVIFLQYSAATDRFGIEMDSDANESVGGPGLPKPPGATVIQESGSTPGFPRQSGFIDVTSLLFQHIEPTPTPHLAFENSGLNVAAFSDFEVPEPGTGILFASALALLLFGLVRKTALRLGRGFWS